MDSYSEYILKSLQKLAKSRKVVIESNKKYARIQCINPQHKSGHEDNPSLRINIVKSGKFSIGAAKCHACGIFFPNWKKLIEGLNRPDLFSSEIQEQSENEFVSFFSNDLEKELVPDEDLPLVELQESIPWTPTDEWRGINGQLLSDINAVMFFNETIQIPMLYLPCYINNEHVGGIRANIKKHGKKNYFYSPGSWVKELGLFPYDYVHKYLIENKLSTVVLVEGPRDALNCIQNDIPALAILGTNNWSETKANILLSLPVKQIITAFDPDFSGDRGKVLVYNSIKHDIKVRNFNFRKYIEKYDLDEDTDPGSMPKKVTRIMHKFII